MIGPQLGVVSIPIPISPYLQDREENKARWKLRYKDTPILGPLTAEGPDIGMDPPSDEQVMMAFEKARPVAGGLPFLYETQRNNVRIVKDKISDYIDPPRVYPLIGPAQVHHVHYKCTIYFTQKDRVGWPIPYTKTNDDGAEVIYIDKDHFHMVGNVNTGAGANF
ncbi:MAG: hypothetical protein K8T25_18015 [Planctomycetia bacterium]|nr:hypothetical protein [Planctomycetia bacterium]